MLLLPGVSVLTTPNYIMNYQVTHYKIMHIEFAMKSAYVADV